jgi:hypothetical protein
MLETYPRAILWSLNSQEENSIFRNNVQKNNQVHPYTTKGANKFHGMPSQKNKAGQNSLFINGLNLFIACYLKT